MESGISALIGLLGRPNQTREVIDVDSPSWTGPEYRLCLSFPADYKELLATFGLHCWGDFIHVLSPDTTNENLHLERAGLASLGALHEIRRKEPDAVPFAVYPERCGLYPWGVTDNGDTLFWLTQGPPDQWPTVVIAARDRKHERHQYTATALLAQFLVGDLDSVLLLAPFEGQKPLLSDQGWSQ